LRGEADPRLYVMRGRWPDTDGYLDLVAFPGPGLIFVFATDVAVPYLPARLDPAHKKSYPLLDKVLFTNGGLEAMLGNRLCLAYKLIDTNDTARTLTFDIRLDPAGAAEGRRPKGGKNGP